MHRINYNTCPYAFLDNPQAKTIKPEYPCAHPRNTEGDCPLNNKKPRQTAPCKLLED